MLEWGCDSVAEHLLGMQKVPDSIHGSPIAATLPYSCMHHQAQPCHLTLNVVLEQFLCAKLQDVIQLLFRHGARLGAKARAHHQMSQHHLPLGHLGDAFLDRRPRHKAVDHHLLILPNPVGSAEGLDG